MNDQQKASYVFAQSVAALAEIESMKAVNQIREIQGHAIAYGEKSFLDVIEKYGLHQNSLITFFGQY